jgi:mannosyltransferase OCH1-like enzyme
MIPKIIHRVFIGSEVPQHAKDSWDLSKSINSGWTHLTHNYDNINEFPITKDFWDLSPSYSFKSDMIRLEALYNLGGFYIDTDIFMIKSFDSLTNTDSIILGRERANDPDMFGCAVMATPPKSINILNTIYKFLEYAQKDAKDPSKGPFSPAWDAFLPRVISELALESEDNLVAKKPREYFYPVPWDPSDARSPKLYKNESASEYIARVSSFITPETYCVHGWAGSWQNKQK